MKGALMWARSWVLTAETCVSMVLTVVVAVAVSLVLAVVISVVVSGVMIEKKSISGKFFNNLLLVYRSARVVIGDEPVSQSESVCDETYKLAGRHDHELND